MKRLTLLSALLLAVPLVACRSTAPQQPPVTGTVMSSSSSSSARSATVEGVLQKAGVGIFMQGSHRLQMDDGTFLLLESTAVRLDDYLDDRVIVTGTVQSTVEAGGMIMTVELIEAAESFLQPEVLVEGGSMSSTPSSASSRRSSPAPMSSPTASSPAPLPVFPPSSPSSPSPTAPSSPASIPSSAAPTGRDVSASIAAMARAAVNSSTFTTTYCSSHIGFCVPVHKYWFYTSFGASISPYLWHVEVSDQSIEEAGQGVIVVNLAAGALTGSEGVAIIQGDFAVASRQWTGNRHFEISGPKELKAAVEFMAHGIEVYTSIR